MWLWLWGRALRAGAYLFGKRMLTAVAGAVNPPDLSRRFRRSQRMEHGEHGGCADAGTQRDDGSVAAAAA